MKFKRFIFMMICLKLTTLFAQDSISKGTIKIKKVSVNTSMIDSLNIIGNWNVCNDTKFSKNYTCKKGYTSYEFYKDLTYKENRQPIYNGVQQPYVKGQWSLTGNILILDENDDKWHKAYPINFSITWINKDLFYAIAQEGGSTIYTYFQRTN